MQNLYLSIRYLLVGYIFCGIGWLIEDLIQPLYPGLSNYFEASYIALYVLMMHLVTFAECEEASDPIYWAPSIELAHNKGCRIYEPVNTVGKDWKRLRDYYGMSTKKAQRKTGGSGCKTSEGIDRPVEVKHPVAKWVDNMQSYLRSCMTYTNSHTIKELRENAQVIILGGSGDAAYRK